MSRDKRDFFVSMRKLPLQQEEKKPLWDHCGIVAAFSRTDRAFFENGIKGLHILQTRGYDGAGCVALRESGEITHHKGKGMVREVFSQAGAEPLVLTKARTWVYQVRYGTHGSFSPENVQPLIGVHAKTNEVFIVAHNGQFAFEVGSEFDQVSDTVRFVNQLAESPEDTWDSRISSLLTKKKGAWSLVIATQSALYLARDWWGIRPLTYGHLPHKDTGDYSWVIASETSAMDEMGAIDCFELLPGTLAKITQDGLSIVHIFAGKKRALCIFENVYIQHGAGKAHLPRTNARKIQSSPTVDDVRRKSGKILAREASLGKHDVDMVIGIPGTGIEGGMSFARSLDIPYFQAITDKADFINEQRTFMTADIESIYKKVLDHFDFDKQALAGRRVVLVDDSIVRGNITKGLVHLLKTYYHVPSVHLRILCPPIDKKCHLGVNTRDNAELFAARHRNNIEEMRQELDADSLAYISAAGLREAMTGNPYTKGFCMGCMAGQQYPVDEYGNDSNAKNVSKIIKERSKNIPVFESPIGFV